jgi:hypothetical protein
VLYLELQSELVTKIGVDSFLPNFEDSCDIKDKPHSTGSDLEVDATSIHMHL